MNFDLIEKSYKDKFYDQEWQDVKNLYQNNPKCELFNLLELGFDCKKIKIEFFPRYEEINFDFKIPGEMVLFIGANTNTGKIEYTCCDKIENCSYSDGSLNIYIDNYSGADKEILNIICNVNSHQKFNIIKNDFEKYRLEKYEDGTFGYTGFTNFDNQKVILKQELKSRENFIKNNNIEIDKMEFGYDLNKDVQIIEGNYDTNWNGYAYKFIIKNIDYKLFKDRNKNIELKNYFYNYCKENNIDKFDDIINKWDLNDFDLDDFIENDSWHKNENNITFFYPNYDFLYISETSCKIIGKKSNNTFNTKIIDTDMGCDEEPDFNYILRNFDDDDINNFKLLNIHPVFYVDPQTCYPFEEITDDGILYFEDEDLFERKKLFYELMKDYKISDLDEGRLPGNTCHVGLICDLEQGYEDPNEIYSKFLNTRIIDLPLWCGEF